MENVYLFINNLDIKNKTVVAAISGGPDSMLLIDTLVNLKKNLNIKIVVAHVHHNLRKQSDDEAIQVENYCNKNNLIFEMMKINKYPNNKFNEETARKIRYDFFEKILKKYNSDILFTAHHGDDLIETILMRLTRGTSLKGYAGFEAISTRLGYKIVRPLIYLTKSEILDILEEKNIKFANDMSNTSDMYTRNRYRKYILPELKKENKNVHYKFIEFNKKILCADEYIKKQTDLAYSKCINETSIDIEKFNKFDYIIRIYILERYLKEIYKDNIISINDRHINMIIYNIINKVNTKFNLPLNKKGIIEYNKFRIINNVSSNNYEYTFTDEIKLPNGKTIKVDNDTKLTTNYVIHLNSKEIKLPFHVRCKKNGDRMIIKNMSNEKKISDIFTDFKLSKELRDDYPIVTDDTGKIIWIPGIKKSYLDRKKEKKYDIILKYD